MDSNVGELFDPSFSSPDVNAKRFFAGVNDKKEIDYYKVENSGTRYYLTWKFPCKYSVFVSFDGFIMSWKKESSTDQNCYVF